MRTQFLFAATLVLASCSSMQYSDNYRAVDANSECATTTPQPGEPVPPWCQREQGVSWSSDSDGEPLDLSGGDGDDD